MPDKKLNVTHFASPEEFRGWLHENHDKKEELIVGYYKKGTGIPSIDWPQSVDQALCYGWIDGIRRKVDEKSYCIRFTPRRADSIWSPTNIKKIAELKKAGLMQPTGLAAYAKKKDNGAQVYAYAQPKNPTLPPEFLKKLKANKKAWAFFEAQVPSYKKPAIWWVTSAKQEATKQRRLDSLIEDSANGLKVKPLRRN